MPSQQRVRGHEKPTASPAWEIYSGKQALANIAPAFVSYKASDGVRKRNTGLFSEVPEPKFPITSHHIRDSGSEPACSACSLAKQELSPVCWLQRRRQPQKGTKKSTHPKTYLLQASFEPILVLLLLLLLFIYGYFLVVSKLFNF